MTCKPSLWNYSALRRHKDAITLYIITPFQMQYIFKLPTGGLVLAFRPLCIA